MKISDVAIAVVVLGVVTLIILPLPTAVMDFMLVINISISVLVLLSTMYAKDALDFSIFPTLTLITTIFRLGLNLASTKLILGNGGDAGNVIRTFSSFVVGDNLVVGAIAFIIIIMMQFIVITKGAERVAEVAARFTLDAMPGKQMAIDADLNSGMINEEQARERRMKIQREADFYGSMDGATKFVKGDSILGILITIVNIVGGLIIGATGIGGGALMPMDQVLVIYTSATIGDGLVSQLPALLMSTATGIIVTRASSDGSLGGDLQDQLFGKSFVLYILSVLLVLLSFVPGMPKIPLFFLALVFASLAFIRQRATRIAQEEPVVDVSETAAAEKRKPESVTSLLQIVPICVEVGYAIIPMMDVAQGGDLLDRVIMIRRQCALDLGIIVPVIRLVDHIQLKPSEYVVKIKGVEVERGEVMVDHFLALTSGGAEGQLKGIPTREPAFGLPALWVTETEREKADLLGYTTVDPPSVIATHLTEIVKRHAHELLSRQQVQTLLDTIKKQQPVLVEEVIPKVFSLGELQKVLCNLLRENISIRDLGTVLETLGDIGGMTRDPDLLTEYVRQALRRSISKKFVPDDKAHVITLDPSLEQAILDNVKQSEQGSYIALEPNHVQRMFVSLKNAIERMTNLGMTPIVLTSPNVRRFFKHLTAQMVPELVVLSYNELEQGVEIYSDGVVSIG